MKSKKQKYFFGWENIKWITKELLNMYSAKSSYFSKKRIESGVAFLVAQWGMVFFLLEKHSDLSMTDMLMWAGAEFAISGYMLAQIQKEKNGKSPASEEE
jgi:hypothetical protein